MSKIEWKGDWFESPFCEQIKVMGWQWGTAMSDAEEVHF